MKLPRRFDASASRAEIVRLLPAATGCESILDEGDTVSGPHWRLRLTPLPPLTIALVRLERHRVEIEFDGLTAEQEDAFMDRFTRHFQRGGG